MNTNNLDYIYLDNKQDSSYSPSSSSSSSSLSSSSPSSSNSPSSSKNKSSNSRTNQYNKKNSKNKELEENIEKLTNSDFNRMFQSNAYSQFKEKIKEILIKEYEIPVYEKLIELKRSRGNKKEYEVGLKGHYEGLLKLKKDTEKSMFQIKQYLDYIESNTVSNNKFSPYLIGFESRYKMGDVVIPDILGITIKERPELKEKFMYFIFILVKQFLDNINFLYLSINKLVEDLPVMIDDLENSNNISLNLCKYYNDTPEMKALKNINNYYNLLSDIIDNGRFNINKLFNDTPSKKENKNKKGGGYDDDRKKKKSLSKKEKALRSLLDYKNKDKKLFSDYNKKGDVYDKKVKYILKYEKMIAEDSKKRDVDINKYDTLKEILRKSWKNIFTKKLKKNLEDLQQIAQLPSNANLPNSIFVPKKINSIEDIVNELINYKNNSVDKEDKQYLNDICKQIKDMEPLGKFTKIVELCDVSSSLTIKDFYTGKDIPTSESIRSDERELQYFYGVRKLYKCYEKYYQNYNINNLPLFSDSKIEQKKIGLNILRGIGNYSSIVRLFLNDSIKRAYMNDVMVRERNRIEKLKIEEEERKKRDRQDQPVKNQREKDEQFKKNHIGNKGDKFKNKIERINEEIKKATNNKVKKKLEDLKLKIISLQKEGKPIKI